MGIIGLDIGTTSICGLLYYRNDLNPPKVAIRNNSFISSEPGEYVQNPEKIYQHIRSILDELILGVDEKIEGISLSTQMHGILYLDIEGNPVSPYYTWQNQKGICKIGNKTVEMKVSEILGYPVYTGYGIVTHYSLFQEKRIPDKAVSFCNIGDFVCMRLVGEKTPKTDVTIGHSLGVYDLKTGELSENLCSLSVDCRKFIPEIVSTTIILGSYKSIPVIQPIGDNQASFVGSVKEREQSLLLNYGTSGQLSFFGEEYQKYTGFETRPLGNEGFIHAAFSLCGGHSYKLLARFFEEVLQYYSHDIDFDCLKGMDDMDLDFSVNDIDCMPLFMGQRGIESKSGYFRNITEENFTLRNVVKALVQGMVNELFQHYTALPETLKNRMNVLVGAGNGIRRNPQLIKAVEVKYGKSLTLLAAREESCIGAVINAGKGVGIFSDYDKGASEVVKYLNGGLVTD